MNTDDTPVGLPLDSPRWQELGHAYGGSTSTTQLIRDLREFTDSGKGEYAELRVRTLNEFGCNLFHQQSRYTATIAAVPHFVSLAAELPSELRLDILYNASWINWLGGNAWIKHDRVNDEIVTGCFVYDEDLIEWYDAAILNAAQLAIRDLSESHPENTDVYRQLDLLKTACGLNGFPHLANLIHWWEERRFECPNCAIKLYACYLDGEYVVWDAKQGCIPKGVARSDQRAVAPYVGATDDLHSTDFTTLLQYTASSTMDLAADWVRSIHGTFTCPTCDHAFRLPEDYGPPTLLKYPTEDV